MTKPTIIETDRELAQVLFEPIANDSQIDISDFCKAEYRAVTLIARHREAATADLRQQLAEAEAALASAKEQLCGVIDSSRRGLAAPNRNKT